MLNLLLVLFAAGNAHACTTAQLNAGTALAPRSLELQSFDWQVGKGYAYVNPVGMKKSAFTVSQTPHPAQWTSAYGSVTFSPTVRELVIGGVNTAGLSVGVMEVDPANQFPADSDPRPTVSEVQWPQYILDTSATLDQAVANANAVRVSPIFLPLHYFVCDNTGACAAMEYTAGQLLVIRGSDLSVKAFANDSYANSLGAWSAYQQSHTLPTDSSFARFIQAGTLVAAFPGWGDPEQYGFYTLSAVRQGSTQWNMVYDPQASAGPAVSFRTMATPLIKTIPLNQLDFACSSPRLALDLDLAKAGNVQASDFVPYTDQLVKALDLQNTYIPAPLLTAAEQYGAQGTSCAQ